MRQTDFVAMARLRKDAIQCRELYKNINTATYVALLSPLIPIIVLADFNIDLILKLPKVTYARSAAAPVFFFKLQIC